MWANPGWLGRERDELLEHLLGLLRADAAVAGAALVGSLGAGTADEWSDIDLLIVMEDHEVARFADRSRKTPWSEAQVLVDGRHNSPAGATSAGAIHVRSGLPFRADLHVYPLSLARWPADSRVVHEARPVETSVMSFTDACRLPPAACAVMREAGRPSRAAWRPGCAWRPEPAGPGRCGPVARPHRCAASRAGCGREGRRRGRDGPAR